MWLAPALFATAIWSIQRAVAKASLGTLSATQYALLSSAIALPVYLPLLWLDPPPAGAFAGAIAVSAVSVVAFLTTTEALKRGPVGRVSPALGFAPVPTVLLAIVFLGERLSPAQAAGVGAGVVALVLLAGRRDDETSAGRHLCRPGRPRSPRGRLMRPSDRAVATPERGSSGAPADRPRRAADPGNRRRERRHHTR